MMVWRVHKATHAGVVDACPGFEWKTRAEAYDQARRLEVEDRSEYKHYFPWPTFIPDPPAAVQYRIWVGERGASPISLQPLSSVYVTWEEAYEEMRRLRNDGEVFRESGRSLDFVVWEELALGEKLLP